MQLRKKIKKSTQKKTREEKKQTTKKAEQNDYRNESKNISSHNQCKWTKGKLTLQLYVLLTRDTPKTGGHRKVESYQANTDPNTSTTQYAYQMRLTEENITNREKATHS